ncbi:hypothetical protein BDN72DRAFT_966411 [Pluteus cervinus]|uniref:Uncharacterized protein n=1 Tax=Pluteus cervinus TaxID=181527 RepID=A0ACD2ZXY2_9AGAR|nr:hypothetical protein BDN72DRAFT_966411 [Pluteus cervinus]
MTVNVADIDWNQTFVPLLAAALAEVLFYGVYVVLFSICTYILLKSPCRENWPFLIPATVMFALSTVDIAFTFRLVLAKTALMFDISAMPFSVAILPKFLIFAVNNFIADLILIHRCYIIWGRNRYVAMCGGVLVVAGLVAGFISELTVDPNIRKYTPIYVGDVVLTNVSMTLMTAGRIWWVARRSRVLVNNEQLGRYRLIVAIIIESGVIYSGCVLLALAIPQDRYVVVIKCIYSRVVCIMPTLIVVQIGLGRAFSSETTHAGGTTITTLRLGSETVILDTMVDTTTSPGQHHQTEQPSSSSIELQALFNTGTNSSSRTRNNVNGVNETAARTPIT